jgi:hypothetical protein
MLADAEREAKQRAAEGDSSSDDEDEEDNFVPREPQEERDGVLAVMRQTSLPPHLAL